MAEPERLVVQRLNYFDHQFLRAEDFALEQEYHLSRRRLHNRLLHTSGIADGLEVEYESGSQGVTVRPGVAVDSDGREIVLAEDRPVDLAGEDPGDLYLTIQYHEELSDPTTETGAEGDTRRTEDPQIASRKDKPRDAGRELVLGVVRRSATREVTGVDTSDRRPAGVVGGSIEIDELSLRHPDFAREKWVRMGLKDAGHALLSGSLTVSGDLTVAGAAEAGSLTLGNGAQRRGDEGGSLEPGGPDEGKETGTPCIDFHFANGREEDYNVRLVNNGDGQLAFVARPQGSEAQPAGRLSVTGDLWVSGQSNVFRVWTKILEIQNGGRDKAGRENVAFSELTDCEQVYEVVPVVTGFSIFGVKNRFYSTGHHAVTSGTPQHVWARVKDWDREKDTQVTIEAYCSEASSAEEDNTMIVTVLFFGRGR